MEKDSTKVAEIAEEMDAGIAGVMPDSWEGHGRLKIAERDLSAEKHGFAQELLGRLSDKYPNVDAEKLAEKAIDATEENLG